MTWANYKDKLKRYFWPTRSELKEFLIVALAFAFILSFTKWGGETFSLSTGMMNLFIAFLVVSFSLFCHHASQRLTALAYGFKPMHKIWLPGMVVGLLAVFFSNGKLMIFAATSLWIHHMPIHRIGWYRHGPNIRSFGIIALFGPIASIVIAAIAKTINAITGSALAQEIFIFNILFAGYNLLPIPPLDGSRVFFASRLIYAFAFCAFLSYIFFTMIGGLSGITPIILAAITGIVCDIVFYIFFERKWV